MASRPLSVPSHAELPATSNSKPLKLENISNDRQHLQGATYIPLGLELFQPHKGIGDGLIGEDGSVLLQRPLADLSVLGFGDGIFEKGLLELVDGDNDAEDLSQRFLEVALCACLCEFDFLDRHRNQPRIGGVSYITFRSLVFDVLSMYMFSPRQDL